MNVQVDDIKGVPLYELQGDIEELLAFAEARSFKTAVALASLLTGHPAAESAAITEVTLHAP